MPLNVNSKTIKLTYMSPEQNQTANTPDYPEYPTPVPSVPPAPRKRRNTWLIIAMILLIFLVVITALALAGKQVTKSTKSSQCANYTCFSDHFTACSPSEYTETDMGGSTHYSIVQNGELGCSVTIKYLKANYSPDVTGQSMTCDLDNGKDLHAAIALALYFPDDFSCTGELTNLVKEVDAIPSQSQ